MVLSTGRPELADSTRTTVAYWMSLTLLLHLVANVLGFLRGSLMGVAGERVVARLRGRLYSHILSQEMGE